VRTPITTLVAAVLVTALFLLPGCSDRDLAELEPAPANDDPVVFDDNFGSGVDYLAFMGSLTDAVSIDTDEAFAGSASLRVTVPGPGNDGGTYAGGAFVSSDFRDLSQYNALVFQAKSSTSSTLDVAGLANDNTGNSLYTAERSSIPLGTDWSLVIVPIPDPSRLDLERGLFFFAEGHENNQGFTMWFDEIRFARVGTILDPRPAMDTRTVDTFVGATVQPEGTRTIMSVNGEDVTVEHAPGYFDYASSEPSVAATEAGTITAVGGGTATVTAQLDTVTVDGEIVVNVLAPPNEAAPVPTYPAADVVSLFSDAYQDVPVDTWRTEWSVAGPVEDMDIAGDAVKVYTDLTYAGIEFLSPTIDASDLTHLRLDVWAPTGTIFRVKLVDFGADGAFGGGDDSEWELVFHAGSTPAFVPGEWSVLDIPLVDFNLASQGHLAQMVISSSDAHTVFLDNVLLRR